jgi:hypothetical protein
MAPIMEPMKHPTIKPIMAPVIKLIMQMEWTYDGTKIWTSDEMSDDQVIDPIRPYSVNRSNLFYIIIIWWEKIMVPKIIASEIISQIKELSDKQSS